MTLPRWLAALAVVFGVIGCGDGSGGSPPPPPGSGAPSLTVFVSSTQSNGNLGGVAGANATCQSLAEAAGLSGSFRAWLSDHTFASGPAQTFVFDSTTGYQLVDGTQIAENWSDLTDGTLDAPIRLDENGVAVSDIAKYVWTNTKTNGERLNNDAFNVCNDWTTGAPQGIPTLGNYTQAGAGWTAGPSEACSNETRLYCFEQLPSAITSVTPTTLASGDLGVYTALALDPAGNPVVNYVDLSAKQAVVLTCDQPDCQGSNTIAPIDGSADGSPSLALDSAGIPVVPFVLGPINGANALEVAVCGNATCTSENVITPIVSGTAYFATSVRLDAAGAPVISFVDSGNESLTLVLCGDPTCASGNDLVPVEQGGDYDCTSLVLDASGAPRVATVDNAADVLKLAICSDPTCTSSTIPHLASGTLQAPSLALNGSGNPVIAYYNEGSGTLELATCSDPTCSSGSTISTVDDAGNVGCDPSLAFRAGSDNPVISYCDLTNGALKLTICGDPLCTAANATIATIDTGNVGEATSLALPASSTTAQTAVISYFARPDAPGDNSSIKLALVDYRVASP